MGAGYIPSPPYINDKKEFVTSSKFFIFYYGRNMDL